MDPESNSPEADDSFDQIDVVALEEQPLEQPILAAEEIIQQERRLEDVRRVRDEAESLRHEICQLRIRLEEVEEESKFHAAKANELTELLMNSHSSSGNSGIDDTILKQSEELARKACQIENLEKKITNLTTEKALLEIERDNAKKETADLSKVVRSLQSVNRSYCEEEDDESEESDEIVLTPETALDLTLGNLKEHIEMLEDGLQASSSLNTAQKKAIVSLEQDNHIQQGKIVMLEELFRELNTNDRLIYKDEQKEDSQETEPSPSSVARDGLVVRFRNIGMGSFTSMVASTSTSTEEKPDIPEEARVEKFKKIRMGSFKSMVASASASTERQPEIPEEAAAAARAAAYLLGHESKDDQPQKTSCSGSIRSASSPNAPSKKGRKTAMKKVKIRFKKAGLEGTYTGPLMDRKPHGVGTIRFSNGDTYLGEMTRGKMSGTGTLYTKTKGVLRGRFENNKFMGELRPPQAEAQVENHEPSDGDSDSGSNNPAAEPTAADEEKACDTTATTVETDDEEDESARANAVAALELDGFSPTTITGSQDIAEGIDDSFNMVDLDGMERKTDIAEIKKFVARRENESFLKEFSGSEESSSSSTIGGIGGLDEEYASSSDEENPALM